MVWQSFLNISILGHRNKQGIVLLPKGIIVEFI
jgi:hypothetical protein